MLGSDRLRLVGPGPSQRARRKERALFIVRDEFPGWLFLGGSLAQSNLSANGNLSLIFVSHQRGAAHMSPNYPSHKTPFSYRQGGPGHGAWIFSAVADLASASGETSKANMKPTNFGGFRSAADVHWRSLNSNVIRIPLSRK